MSDKSQLFARYQKLKEAMQSGMLSVSYEGQSVSFMSRADMRAVLDEMELELGLVKPRGGVLSRTRPARYDKGL